jgi:hypothetical protein
MCYTHSPNAFCSHTCEATTTSTTATTTTPLPNQSDSYLSKVQDDGEEFVLTQKCNFFKKSVSQITLFSSTQFQNVKSLKSKEGREGEM